MALSGEDRRRAKELATEFNKIAVGDSSPTERQRLSPKSRLEAI